MGRSLLAAGLERYAVQAIYVENRDHCSTGRAQIAADSNDIDAVTAR